MHKISSGNGFKAERLIMFLTTPICLIRVMFLPKMKIGLSKYEKAFVTKFLNWRSHIKSVYKWPTSTNDIINFPVDEVLDHCHSLRPILHKDTKLFIEKFLDFKKNYGSTVGY